MRRHGAFLLLDDAHSFRSWENGSGPRALGIEDEIDFVTGTFSKSPSVGGFFGAESTTSPLRVRFAPAVTVKHPRSSPQPRRPKGRPGARAAASRKNRMCMKASRFRCRRSAEPGHRQPHGRPGCRGGSAGPSRCGVYPLIVPQGPECSRLRSRAHREQWSRPPGYAAVVQRLFDQPRRASAYA